MGSNGNFSIKSDDPNILNRGNDEDTSDGKARIYS